jgi:hypothetical protein
VGKVKGWNHGGAAVGVLCLAQKNGISVVHLLTCLHRELDMFFTVLAGALCLTAQSAVGYAYLLGLLGAAAEEAG